MLLMTTFTERKLNNLLPFGFFFYIFNNIPNNVHVPTGGHGPCGVHARRTFSGTDAVCRRSTWAHSRAPLSG